MSLDKCSGKRFEVAKARVGNLVETRKGTHIQCVELIDKCQKRGFIYTWECPECSTYFDKAYQDVSAGLILCPACAQEKKAQLLKRSRCKE